MREDLADNRVCARASLLADVLYPDLASRHPGPEEQPVLSNGAGITPDN